MINSKEVKRIVFKVGTSSLTYDTGKINIRRMSALARVLSDLKNAGKEIVAGRLPPRSVSASLCSYMTSFSANSATRSVSSL